jgi:hypothetical protein
MITVGLIKELYFISKILNTEVRVEFHLPASALIVTIKDNILSVFYRSINIWLENLEGETSFFGVESCDAIARILVCIDNDNLKDASELYYIESNIDKIPSMK